MTAATDHRERPARLERAYEHLATKAENERLQAGIVQWLVDVGFAGAALAAIIASTVVTSVLT